MGFAKTYLTLLKTYPLTTNLASGCVLMTVGDGVAQSIENSNSNTTDINSTNNNSSFTTDGNKSTILDDNVCSTTTTTTTATYETIRDRIRMAVINLGNAASTTQNFNRFTAAQSSSTSSSSVFPDIFFLFSNSSTVTSMYTESWDPFRTGTMACWTFFYAPLWVTVYKLYNKYLPKGPTGVVARVALTFATSIPVNAAFYTYGTTVHHTHEWWQEQQQEEEEEEQQQCDDGDKKQDVVQSSMISSLSSYQFDELREKVLAKLEAEMPTTVMRSAYCWIPFNFVVFSVVPPHIQPLSLMFGAVFWNCYLSLTQHRDIPTELLEHHHLAADHNTAGHHHPHVHLVGHRKDGR